MRTNQPTIGALLAAALLLPGVAIGQTGVDGVAGITPAGDGACLAVEIPLQAGESLVGLRWFHNDGMTTFPELLLMEAVPGQPPDLANTGMILEQLGAASLAWGEITLSQPVTSTTGTILAVLVYPPSEKTGEGTNGGPAVGYRTAAGNQRSYVSPDGVTWVKVHPETEIAVDPICAQLKSQGVPLSLLRDDVAASGWQWQPDDEAPISNASAGLTLTVSPNPFNPRAEIRFHLQQDQAVTLDVYDVRGRRVRRLLAGTQSAGEYHVTWEGDDDHRSPVASAVYWIRLIVDGQVHQRSVALVR